MFSIIVHPLSKPIYPNSRLSAIIYYLRYSKCFGDTPHSAKYFFRTSILLLLA